MSTPISRYPRMRPEDRDWQLRYSRHLALPGFGAPAQERLAASRLLIVGLGGLGCPAALYLAAAGAGALLLNDFDRVDASNLARQVLFDETQLGADKTAAAAEALRRINPHCRLETLDRRLDEKALQSAVRGVDAVLDGSDNFGTRFAVNAACMMAGKPLVSGAALRYGGQVAVFDPRDAASPCYACLYGEGDEALENCQANGVFAPLTGLIGSLMAGEAIKLVTATGTPLTGRLWQFDARDGSVRVSRVRRDPSCRVCAGRSHA